MKKIYNLLLLTIFFFSPAIASAEFSFNGSGCWITNGSLGNEFLKSDVFDWYVANNEVLADINFPITKPFILALGTKKNPISNDVTSETIGSHETTLAIKAIIESYRNISSAVIWDFEYQCAETGNCTAQEINARKLYLEHIYKFVRDELGLKFGISVWGGPNSYHEGCGLSYAEVSQFCDFIVPQLYCQKNDPGGCESPSLTQDKWIKENNAATVPLVALAAIKTTGPVVEMTPSQLISNYGTLSPKPISMGYWNPSLAEDHVSAINKVENISKNYIYLKIDQSQCDLSKGNAKISFNPPGGYNYCTKNCYQNYAPNTQISLSAGAEGSGCIFDHWEGMNCSEQNCAFQVSEDFTIKAIYGTDAAPPASPANLAVR